MPVPDLFNQKVDGVAWRSKPSWYILASEDRTVQPDLHRFVAKRMGATAVELRSSHPDALPAECCDGRHPQRRESPSEIAGGLISGSQICVTGKRVTTFERSPRGGLFVLTSEFARSHLLAKPWIQTIFGRLEPFELLAAYKAIVVFKLLASLM